MLRNAVSDTQSEESFHSAVQSPRRTELADTPQSSQKRKNDDLHTEGEEVGVLKRIRSDPTTPEPRGALQAWTIPDGLQGCM